MKIVKKAAAWLAALAMVISFLPLAGTEAYADVGTMDASLSEDGILTWENVPSANTYTWDVDSSRFYTVQNEWEADVYSTLDELAATEDYRPEGGEYVITIGAYQDDALVASRSFTIDYTPRVIPALSVTVNGVQLSWPQVTDADYYMVTVAGNGNSQEDTACDLSRIIDKLIKQGYLANDRTEWPVQVIARDPESRVLAKWNGTVEYASQAEAVIPEEITPVVSGTTVEVPPVSGADSYELEYASHINVYDSSPFDCQDLLNRLGDEGLIEDGETITADLSVLDADGVVIGQGTVTVTYTAAAPSGVVTDTIDIGNIWMLLQAGQGVFTTEINPDYYIGDTPLDSVIYIENEFWTDTETGDIVTRDSGEFVLGHTYEYTVVIGTHTDHAISEDFEFIVGGSRITDYTLADSATCPEGYVRVALTGFLQATVESEGPVPALAKLDKSSFVYNGKEQRPAVTVTAAVDGETVTLKEGEDYVLVYSGGNSKDAGSYYVEVRGINPRYDCGVILGYDITPKKITPAVTLSASSYTYNGKVRKPTVTVKNGTTKLTTANYTVTCYTSAGKKITSPKSVGKYKVTVKLKGNYTGTKTVYYKINPKNTTLLTPAAASRAVTVKWKKLATKMSTARISGYQIQVATNSKFTTGKKTVNVAGYTKISKKITGLKGGKRYYVRIRTYKTISGVKYYSPWSKAKIVTTKK